ncbi:MAG: DegQ family serine endoprotease [Desulfobulbaceae bacterium]|uniref:DegQ family serine endoprotease n=1 Tax=Candidatus Desulfatifera sulfidica TaxID=2841691 RepID=A0A8J6N8H9_9BACT|nr:DegQ family serine endoprotease [Candidatus Desulfatifera sulfidica]
MNYRRITPLFTLLFLLFLTCTNPAAATQNGLSALNHNGNTVIADVAENSVNSVVNISSTKINKGRQPLSPFFNDPFFREFFGPNFDIPRERQEKSLGSGVIVSKDGIILTNNHVVENAEEILVTLADNRELEAEIVGTDPKSDVAVIRLKKTPGDLKPLTIGDSSQMRLGEVVLAIGNPFGLGHTVTMGIISAKGRADVGINDYEDFIQTDAAINPGNSGGALLNLHGELIGINSAIISRSGGYQGIGFAIPSNMAQAVMDSLIAHGRVVRGWLGVSIQNLDRNLAEAMGLNINSGVLISDIIDDSPAARAGLKRGDIIRKVNSQTIDNASRLRNSIASLGSEAKIKLAILRNQKEKIITVHLTAQPEDIAGGTPLDDDEGVLAGLNLSSITPTTREQYKITPKIKQGIVITGVKRDSKAQQAGLRPGDVILELNQQPVDSIKTFSKIYKAATDKILLVISRQNSTFYLVLNK